MNVPRAVVPSRTELDIAQVIAELVGVAPRSRDTAARDHAAGQAAGPVAFVEAKQIDWRRVQEILGPSQRANHWTNFGPACRALEGAVAHLLELPPERSVLACASATTGLAALAGLHAARAGRRLRWVVSSYTFFNQRLGPFADAIVVDCGDDGLINRDAMATLPAEGWDGLVLTNLFGAVSDYRPYAAFCRARGKALIVDSAAALFGPLRSAADLPEEAISFHHTKPWGVGEGGCVVVAREDAALVQSMLSFGVGGPDTLRPYSGNGKISDIACALILERLERLPDWAPRYREQRNRIERLGAALGLRPLHPAPDTALRGSVPFLAPRPVPVGALPDAGVRMCKYYPPLDRQCGNAMRIFDHIVNVPCHPDMSRLPDEVVIAALRRLGAHNADDEAGSAG